MKGKGGHKEKMTRLLYELRTTDFRTMRWQSLADELRKVCKEGKALNEKEKPTLVYCTYCNKTHAVMPGEKPCAPNAWIDPAPAHPKGGR